MWYIDAFSFIWMNWLAGLLVDENLWYTIDEWVDIEGDDIFEIYTVRRVNMSPIKKPRFCFCSRITTRLMRQDAFLLVGGLLRVTLVVDWRILPQNFVPVVGTYEGLLQLCKCRWGGDCTCRWWGHLTSICCHQTFSVTGGGDPKAKCKMPFAPFTPLPPPPCPWWGHLTTMCFHQTFSVTGGGDSRTESKMKGEKGVGGANEPPGETFPTWYF